MKRLDASRGVQAALLWLAATLVAGVPVSQATAAARAVNPTGRQLELQTPVMLNGIPAGDLLLRMAPDGALSVATDGFLGMLDSRLATSLVTGLTRADAGGRLDFESLEALGMTTAFDMGTLTVSLEVPLAQLARQTLTMSTAATGRPEVSVPSRLSAHANLRAAFVQSESSGVAAERGSFLGVDGAVRYRFPLVQFGLDSASSEADGTHVRRRYTRLLFDLPERASRLALGDLSFPGDLFQATEDVLGLVVYRDRQRSPVRTARRGISRQFSLDTPAEVSVYIDGVPSRSFQLGPGTYDLEDIPLVQGSNDVSIEIVDATGDVERIDFSTVFDAALQVPGETDWSLGLGVRRATSLDGLDYRTDEPLVQGSIRAGLNPRLTAETSLRLAEDQADGTLALVTAIPLGSVRLDVGFRDDRAGPARFGMAARFQSYAFRGNPSARVNLGVEYRDENFDTVQSLTPLPVGLSQDSVISGEFATDIDQTGIARPADALDAYIDYSRALWASLSFASSARYTSSRDRENLLTLSASLRGRLSLARGFSWTVRARTQFSDESGDELTGSAGVSYRFGTLSALTRVEPASDTVDVGLGQRVGGTNNGGYSAEAALRQEADVESNAALTLGYTANRYRLEFNHRDRSRLDGDDSRQTTTSIRAQTTLALAGSALAIGRPIGSSFAIVGSHATLDGRQVRVQPDGESESARSGWFGDALLSDVGYANVREIGYEVADLPLGYDLGDGVFFVAAPLGAGYDLTVGSAAVMTVIGTLIDAVDGSPVSLVSGQAVPAGPDASSEPLAFFTNRTGRFALSGIAPGEYTLELATSPPRTVGISVPENGDTLFRAGETTLP